MCCNARRVVTLSQPHTPHPPAQLATTTASKIKFCGEQWTTFRYVTDLYQKPMYGIGPDVCKTHGCGHIGFNQKIIEISGLLGEFLKMCFNLISVSMMYQCLLKAQWSSQFSGQGFVWHK